MQIVLVREKFGEKFVCKAQLAMPVWWGSNQTLGPPSSIGLLAPIEFNFAKGSSTILNTHQRLKQKTLD